MAALTTTALIAGLSLAAVGTGVQVYGSQKAASAQEDSINAQKRAESIRLRQSQLEESRRKRSFIREFQIKQAQAEAAAVSQGAQFGSALPGAIGGLTNTLAYNTQGARQAGSLGEGLFRTNQQQLNASQDQAAAGAIGGIGQGVSTLGGVLLSNLGQINSLSGGKK